MRPSVFTLILLLLCAFSISAQPDMGPVPSGKMEEALFKLGLAVSDTGRDHGYQKAAAMLEAVTDPDILKEPRYHFMRAEVYMRLKNFQKADENYQRAADLDLARLKENLEPARIELAAGDNLYSPIYLMRVSSSYNNIVGMNFTRQQAFRKENSIEYLRPVSLNAVVEAESLLPEVLYLRGRSKMMLKENEEALRLLNLAIQYQPNYLAALTDRAALHRALGKIPFAEADEKKIKELTPPAKEKKTN